MILFIEEKQDGPWIFTIRRCFEVQKVINKIKQTVALKLENGVGQTPNDIHFKYLLFITFRNDWQISRLTSAVLFGKGLASTPPGHMESLNILT